MNRPSVLVTTRRTTRKHKFIDYVGEAHLALLIRLGLLPVMVPVVDGTPDVLPQYAGEMHGLLLVEGEDVEPSRYKAKKENLEYLEKTHPLKDEIEFWLVERALKNGVPLLGICRGSQLLNVACGGTLFGDVQKEKQSPLKHLDVEHYDAYRHGLSVIPGTPLARWYGEKKLRVNSYHHQGVRRLAPCFKAMARAEDGLIEAYYDPKAAFVVGLQFHPERMLSEYAGNEEVWKAFASAAHRYRAGAAVEKK